MNYQKPPGVRCVVFDAVGTLLSPLPAVADVYHAAGVRHGSRLSLETVGQRFKTVFRRSEDSSALAPDVPSLAASASSPWQTSEELEFIRWRWIVGQVLDDLSPSALSACFDELHCHFARPSAWKVDPHTGTVLQTLADQGLRLLVASNFDERLEQVRAGLPELAPLAGCVISSRVGWRKPSPQFYAAVLEAAGVPAEQILMVGDDPVNDVAGARDCGMSAVLLDPSGHGAAPAITSLLQLL